MNGATVLIVHPMSAIATLLAQINGDTLMKHDLGNFSKMRNFGGSEACFPKARFAETNPFK